MGIKLIIIGLCCFPHVVTAETTDVSCAGDDWTMTLRDRSATFAYLDRSSDMEVMQQSIAEGADWPIAMTVVGPRDSAIVILERPAEDAQQVRVLTQRGETPILLAGICGPLPQ